MPETRPQRPWMLVLSYLAFLGFVPLLMHKNDRQVRWHAKNGLLLFGLVVLVGVGATLIGSFFPALGCLYVIVMPLMAAFYAVVVILAIIKALQGERLIVPGISRYADRI